MAVETVPCDLGFLPGREAFDEGRHNEKSSLTLSGGKGDSTLLLLPPLIDTSWFGEIPYPHGSISQGRQDAAAVGGEIHGVHKRRVSEGANLGAGFGIP